VSIATQPLGSPFAVSTQIGDTTGAPVVRVNGLVRAFGGRRVLDGVDLQVRPGEIVALIGRSGSGKSTLLRILAGLDEDVAGDVEVAGRVAVAFQDARLLLWKRVRENVALGLRDPDRVNTAEAALAEVGLDSHLRAWPLTLSGGEAQRVSLARALVREPDLMLLDEPFGALDALTRLAMQQLVLDLWRRHRPAILLVTHDVDEALALADRVVLLADGRIAHEERVALERPREREHHDVAKKRIRLLTELGVYEKGAVL
jgi:sulfonate transport system ATP-binding protein